MRLLRFAFLLGALSAFGVAQTSDTVSLAPSKQEVLKFMELLQLRSRLTQYFEGFAKQAKLGAEEGFKQKIPDATPEQIAVVDKFADNLFSTEMPIDEMLDAMVPIYQKHLTKGDLEAILNFYSSPVGQKLLREQPAMMEEGMQVGGEIGRRRISATIEKMDEFISELCKQEQQKQEQHKTKE